jgi:hypothetical protein
MLKYILLSSSLVGGYAYECSELEIQHSDAIHRLENDILEDIKHVRDTGIDTYNINDPIPDTKRLDHFDSYFHTLNLIPNITKVSDQTIRHLQQLCNVLKPDSVTSCCNMPEIIQEIETLKNDLQKHKNKHINNFRLFNVFDGPAQLDALFESKRSGYEKPKYNKIVQKDSVDIIFENVKSHYTQANTNTQNDTVCCQAMTAQCFACKLGIAEHDLLSYVGCPTQHPHSNSTVAKGVDGADRVEGDDSGQAKEWKCGDLCQIRHRECSESCFFYCLKESEQSLDASQDINVCRESCMADCELRNLWG